MSNYKFDYSYESPTDLHLIVKNVYQVTILQYLLQLQNGYKSVHPSQNTLRLGMMSKPVVDNAIDALIDFGFVKKIKHPLPKANEYIVCYDAINYAIKKALSTAELGKRAKREYTEKERDAMTVRRSVLKPELAHKAETLLGNTVVNPNTAEVLNDKE